MTVSPEKTTKGTHVRNLTGSRNTKRQDWKKEKRFEGEAGSKKDGPLSLFFM